MRPYVASAVAIAALLASSGAYAADKELPQLANLISSCEWMFKLLLSIHPH